MTADIINLRGARKSRDRAAKVQEAERNRANFGRTKAERKASAAAAERSAKLLDGMHINAPANQGSFPTAAAHDGDDEFDPGNVS